MSEYADPMDEVYAVVDAVIDEVGADDPSILSELTQAWGRNPLVMERIRFRLGPTTAQFDAHMIGDSIHGHAARAEVVANLLTGITEASKEIAKVKMETEYLRNDYLVHGIQPGSVRLLIEAPHRKMKLSKKTGDVVPDGVREAHHVPSPESDALRRFAMVLSAADPSLEASQFDDLVRSIPPAARAPFKSVAETVTKGDFEITGEVRERQVRPVELLFTPDRAETLVSAIDRQPIPPKKVEREGLLDGFRKSARKMYLLPKGRGSVSITVLDEEQLATVAALATNPDQYVRVHYTERVVDGVPAKNRQDARVLDRIEPIAPPSEPSEQYEVNLDI